MEHSNDGILFGSQPAVDILYSTVRAAWISHSVVLTAVPLVKFVAMALRTTSSDLFSVALQQIDKASASADHSMNLEL